MTAETMTSTEQVALHELVEDARRVLLSRKTEEAHAVSVVLSHLRASINERLRTEQRVGLAPHALRRACHVILASPETGESRTEWGVRWRGDSQAWAQADRSSESAARALLDPSVKGAEVVSRTVRVGSWTAADVAGAL